MTESSGHFRQAQFQKFVRLLIAEIQDLYLQDAVPWIVGYSGGKDSTATLQLVWMALRELPAEQRVKPVHVISTDTMVENPVVASWVTHSLDTMRAAAEAQGVPVRPHRLTPSLENSFWVNLIGRGYPAPRVKFRWCTERLKIAPSNDFINGVTRDNGEAILVLGMRKAESNARAKVMERLEGQRTRARLSPNDALANCLVYSPIEDWTSDDVWTFLMQVPNPWGYNNSDLLTMYQGASEDGECPLVVDTSTPSCGDSRFGCWVCTMVDEDKSMTAMIQNDKEKEWMLPLLALRNALDLDDDKHLRDFRRMNGKVFLADWDVLVHGPYLQSAREDWLKRLLDAQYFIRHNPTTPDEVRGIELISLDELQEIRRIWVVDKHEIEDSLPRIYEAAMHAPYPGAAVDDQLIFGPEEIGLLKDACGGDDIHFQMARELISIERQYRARARRAGLFDALEKAVAKGAYTSAEEALELARQRRDRMKVVIPIHTEAPTWIVQRRDDAGGEA